MVIKPDKRTYSTSVTQITQCTCNYAPVVAGSPIVSNHATQFNRFPNGPALIRSSRPQIALTCQTRYTLPTAARVIVAFPNGTLEVKDQVACQHLLPRNLSSDRPNSTSPTFCNGTTEASSFRTGFHQKNRRTCPRQDLMSYLDEEVFPSTFHIFYLVR